MARMKSITTIITTTTTTTAAATTAAATKASPVPQPTSSPLSRLARIQHHLSPDGKTISMESKDASSKQETPAMKVCVTGGAGNIGYVLSFLTGNGRLLGPNQPIELRLLEIPPMKEKVEGVAMELRDGAFPLLKKIIPTTDVKVAFEGCQVALLVGAMPRKKGMLRSELLQKNAGIFKAQGKALNDYADKNVKVLVVGNPANANAMVCAAYAPDLPTENITAMTRLDQNRAVSMLATRIGSDAKSIKNVVVWGNHSTTMYPDINYAFCVDSVGMKKPLSEAIDDTNWVRGQFLEDVRGRGSAIIKARGGSSVASAASAACDHIRDWFLGTAEKDTLVSMAVPSDGDAYGVPKGVVCSFPCLCLGNFKYKIVKDLRMNDFSKKALEATVAELVQQRKDALAATK
mmetsp:Transcript_30966/g.75505  ORF Transcript_30966/g.75505 Transcript_30966/m.75505 type:complete len:404 (-) Transcript_30966:155-1366(-)